MSYLILMKFENNLVDFLNLKELRKIGVIREVFFKNYFEILKLKEKGSLMHYI